MVMLIEILSKKLAMKYSPKHQETGIIGISKLWHCGYSSLLDYSLIVDELSKLKDIDKSIFQTYILHSG